MRILLVDDERFSRSLMADGLRSLGFEIVEAESALEALDLWTSEEFDTVVTDIVMDGMNGLELARRLAADLATRSSAGSSSTQPARQTHLVALTGSVTDTKDQASFAEVFDTVLSKPILPEAVAVALLGAGKPT